MTWARNILFLGSAFMFGKSEERSGWHDFAVNQAVWLVILAVIICVWFGLDQLERRVKGKPNAAITLRSPSSGATANVPVRYCPKCGVRLARGAFAHVESCEGFAA